MSNDHQAPRKWDYEGRVVEHMGALEAEVARLRNECDVLRGQLTSARKVIRHAVEDGYQPFSVEDGPVRAAFAEADD